MLIKNYFSNKTNFLKIRIISIFFSFRVLFFFEFENFSSDNFVFLKKLSQKYDFFFINLLNKLNNYFYVFKDFFFNSSIFLVFTNNLRILPNLFTNNYLLSNLVGFSVDLSFVNLLSPSFKELLNVIARGNNNYLIIMSFFFKIFFI